MQLRSEPDPRRFCTADGKYIFPTAQDAMAASKRKGQGVVPYTCEDKFWHIGHQIKRNRKMDKRERIELNFAIFRSNYLEHHTDIDLNEPRVRDNMSEDLEKIEAGMIALLEED